MIKETDLYKDEYLKYKRDYLILKNQISGSKVFDKNYSMYIILDQQSYDTIVRKIIHFDLSIVNIELDLIGSAIKITEGSSNIEFILPDNNDDIIRRNIKRNAGILLKISLPEYKYKNNIKKDKNIIGKIKTPYKFGNVYNTKEFIKKMSDIVVENLQRRKQITEDNIIDYTKYEDINVEKSFYGIIIFSWTFKTCNFIEAYKLEPEQDNTNSSQSSNSYLKINSIAKLGENNYTLIRDNDIIDSRLPFIEIL